MFLLFRLLKFLGIPAMAISGFWLISIHQATPITVPKIKPTISTPAIITKPAGEVLGASTTQSEADNSSSEVTVGDNTHAATPKPLAPANNPTPSTPPIPTPSEATTPPIVDTPAGDPSDQTPPQDTPTEPIQDTVDDPDLPGSGPTCGGGYPARWCQVAQDSVLDSWGMYNRESVSYTAFRVHEDFLLGKHLQDMPYWGGRGDAKQWDDNALADGIPVDNTPESGDIAISNRGSYGFSMYVESVNIDGTINISSYSLNLSGQYSINTISPIGLVFIHFP